jgi:hypothetical protein
MEGVDPSEDVSYEGTEATAADGDGDTAAEDQANLGDF